MVIYTCPACKAPIGVNDQDGELHPRPAPVAGDVGLCMACGNIFLFAASGALVTPTLKGLSSFAWEDKERYERLRRLQGRIRGFAELPNLVPVDRLPEIQWMPPTVLTRGS